MKPFRRFDNDSPFRIATFPAGSRFFAVSAIVLAIALFAGMTAVYGQFYADKIFPGISVLNANVGGDTQTDAKEIVRPQLEGLIRGELTIRYDDQKWTVSLATFGLRYDLDATVKSGYLMGRRGNILDQLGDRLSALFGGHQMPASVWFDRPTQEATLAPIIASVERASVDARLAVAADGSVTVSRSQSRLQVDVDQTLQNFANSFTPFAGHQLDLVVREVPPDVVESDLTKPRADAQVMISKPITLKLENKSWTMGKDLLQRMVVFSRANGTSEKVVAHLDEAALADYLSKVSTEIEVEPKDAELKYDGGEVVIIPGADGQVLDANAAIAAIQAQALTDQREIGLARKKQSAAIAPANLQEAKALAEKMIAAPLKLEYGDSTWTLSRNNLGNALVFTSEGKGANQKIVPSIGKDGISDFLARVDDRISQPAKDARFSFQNGALSLLSPSTDGLALDADATVAAINAQTRLGNRTVQLATSAIKPAVQSSDKDKIVIKDLLQEARTSYAGSIPERAHNVELATSRLNGVVVPPGGVFSMNDSMGPATLANGYELGYGITMSGTEVVTVPSEGGGICQVATTIYQAAFWAGLPIVERLNHMYYISRYGQPPTGMKGMDATVDPPYLDFRFKNSTSNWLAIEARTDGDNVYFRIYGTKTGWKVKVDGPEITDVVPVDPEMVYQEDPTMPWGREIMVEEAEDGFTSTIVRTVYQDDKLIDKYVAVSRYEPSRNVTVIGTKDRPEPSPAATDAKADASARAGAKDQAGAQPTATPSATPTLAPTATTRPAKKP